MPDLAAMWSRLDSSDLRLADLAKLLTELKSEIATVIDHARDDQPSSQRAGDCDVDWWRRRPASALPAHDHESFAEHLGVAVRTIANWRKQPEIIPKQLIQEALDTALQRAPDRAKAQFTMLAERGKRADRVDSPGKRYPHASGTAGSFPVSRSGDSPAADLA